MSARSKSDSIPRDGFDPPASLQGTLQIGGEERAFDDSTAPTLFVDILTEAGAVNGIVCLGLGHLILPLTGNPYAKGDVHLRMSLPMAGRVLDALSGAMRSAHAQQSKMQELDALSGAMRSAHAQQSKMQDEHKPN